MRTVNANTLASINRQYSSEPLWRATVYNDKLYTSTVWQNNYVSAMNGKPQSFCYNSGQSLMYAVFNDGGTLKGVKHNSTGTTTIVSGVNQYTKPLLRYISGTLYLYYMTSTGYLTRATLDNNFGVTASAVDQSNYTSGIVAIYPSNPDSADVVMVLEAANDAYRWHRASWSGSDWGWTTWDGKIAFPGRRVTDFDELQQSATTFAVLSGGSCTFCFVSDYNPSPPSVSDRTSGKVYGVYYNQQTSEWSDVYIALPADLSYCIVQNGFSYNSVMYLAVTFARRDIVTDSSTTRLLFCKSTDGINWSLAEHDLFTTGLDNAQGWGDASYFYAGVNNKYYRSARPGSLSLSIPFNKILEFQDQMNTSGGSSATLSLVNSNEYYNTQSLMAEGNRVVVEAGYKTTGGDEYVVWGTYCIDSMAESYADAERSFQVRLVSEGVYKSMQYIHPVEFELIGKGYYYKDFSEEGGTYTAANAGIHKNSCMIDFWDGKAYQSIEASASMQLLKNDGVTPISFSASHDSSFLSADLKELLNLVDYPTPLVNQATGALQTISVSVWGWSRAPSGNSNDKIIPFLIIERDGQLIEKNTFTTPYPSPDRPPKYYDGTASGNYPIVYYFLMGINFQEGDKIKHVGIRFDQTNATKTLIERVQISNINITYSDGYGNTPWEHDQANGRYSMQRYGRPFVQFIQEPGNPEFFQAWGEFEADNTSAYSEWGVIGFGYDARNFVAGVLAKSSGNVLYPAIVQYIDGNRHQWTASTTSINPANKHYIMFEHAYGKINLYTRQSTVDTWTLACTATLHNASLTQAAAKDGAILHVGYYAMIKPTMMQIVGYKPVDEDTGQKNDGIAILPGYDTELGSMPSNGTVKIGDASYTYGAKVIPGALFGNKIIGPFQAIAMRDYSGTTAVDNTCFKYGETGDVTGFLAADAGYAWEISDSVWDITDDVDYAFASRHYGTNMEKNYLSNNHRTYFSGGFKTITNGLETRNHSWGEWLFQKQNDIIYIYKFAAAGGTGQQSIRDMADYILSAAGAASTWADYTATTLAIPAGGYTYIRTSSDKAPFGFDIEWMIPAGGITDGQWIAIYYARGFKIGVETGHRIGVRRSGSTYYICALNDALSVMEEISVGSSPGIFRFILNGDHCTVLEGGAWAHTFFFTDDGGSRSSTVAFAAPAGYNPTIRFVKSIELFAEREAVIFAMSATPQSALNDVIQERPILYIPKSDGSLLLSYYNDICPVYGPTAYAVSAVTVLGQITSKRTEKESASDLIAHYSEGMKLYTNILHLQNRGFKTSIVSVPNIGEDEIDFQMALKMKTDWESKEFYQISMRPDYRIEPGDLIDFSFTLSGTGTVIDLGDIYVQDVSISAAQNIMQLTCRRKNTYVDG